jgi:hypothetical protein
VDDEERRVCKASVIKLLQIATCLIFIRVTMEVRTDFYRLVLRSDRMSVGGARPFEDTKQITVAQ